MNSAPERLLLEGVALSNQAGRLDIEVIGGRIAALTPSRIGNGGVVTTLLADAHVHLDKTYTIERTKGRVEGLFDAIALVEEDMRQWTADDIRERAGRALEDAYLNGVCALRSHVDWPGPDMPLAWAVLRESVS